jgi:outer membrane protein assembly factor BamB
MKRNSTFVRKVLPCVCLAAAAWLTWELPIPQPAKAGPQASGTSEKEGEPVRRNWPRFRGPNGDGITDENFTPLDQPKQVWKTSVGHGCSSVVIQDGLAYTTGSHPGRGTHLRCLDASTGELVWEQPTHCWYQVSTPVVSGGRVYQLATPQDRPVAFCFEAGTGKPVWKKELPKPEEVRSYGHAGSPLLWEDLVILNVGTGVALKQETGEVVWQHAGKAGLATPVLCRDRGAPAVLIFAGEALIAREPRTGRELWSIPWQTEIAVNACDPIYHDGKVFISTTYGKHAALFDVNGGQPKMLWRGRGSAFSSGLLHDRHLYCFTGDNFSCLDFQTGEERWAVNRVGKGSVLLAGDKLLLLSERGELTVAKLSTSSFTPILRHRVLDGTNWIPAAFADGRLYARNKEGEVICLQIGTAGGEPKEKE